ncbi:collagen alpha-1(I) chain-like [Vombatus ursinus]|uniref:collagen alpha-1(I) chain-like n=1 Tax=Vombatus ursinus TaxID=29139 RepID=UPI000FFD2DAB|nr:collagen alpha-1(I) chain-like [Vombatus ursinus]
MEDGNLCDLVQMPTRTAAGVGLLRLPGPSGDKAASSGDTQREGSIRGVSTRARVAPATALARPRQPRGLSVGSPPQGNPHRAHRPQDGLRALSPARGGEAGTAAGWLGGCSRASPAPGAGSEGCPRPKGRSAPAGGRGARPGPAHTLAPPPQLAGLAPRNARPRGASGFPSRRSPGRGPRGSRTAGSRGAKPRLSSPHRPRKAWPGASGAEGRGGARAGARVRVGWEAGGAGAGAGAGARAGGRARGRCILGNPATWGEAAAPAPPAAAAAAAAAGPGRRRCLSRHPRRRRRPRARAAATAAAAAAASRPGKGDAASGPGPIVVGSPGLGSGRARPLNARPCPAWRVCAGVLEPARPPSAAPAGRGGKAGPARGGRRPNNAAGPGRSGPGSVSPALRARSARGPAAGREVRGRGGDPPGRCPGQLCVAPKLGVLGTRAFRAGHGGVDGDLTLGLSSPPVPVCIGMRQIGLSVPVK